jgi:hypothetical protein
VQHLLYAAPVAGLIVPTRPDVRIARAVNEQSTKVSIKFVSYLQELVFTG